MAGFTDTLRGDGLVRAQRALSRLEGDSLRLNRERQRFSHSPPPYTSNPSTRSASPNDLSEEQRRRCRTRSVTPSAPSEEQRLRQERRAQLWDEREASKPHKQFSAQVEEERRRIWNADPRTSWMKINPGDDTFKKEASETVKKRWVEQGIWNSNWNQFAYGRWKHEEPLELESESEADMEAGPSLPLFSFFPKPQPKSRQPKSDDESRRIAERRVIREREREASRPFHQFFYQVSKERERIQDESTSGEGTGTADINTRAYEKVKNTWSKRGIWNKRWGVLPGMLWKHEEPLEETADGPAQANPVENGSHEVGEASIITMNGAPLRNVFGHPMTNLLESGIPSPVESNHRQVASVMNTSQQGSSTDGDSTGLENGDAERSPSLPNSPRFRTGQRVLRPMTRQASRPSKREPSHKEGQPQPVTNTSLGPVHPSKISKATGKKRAAPQRRPRISKSVSSGGLVLSSAVDSAKVPPSPARVAPRRSKRIQPPEPGMLNDTTGMASTDSIRGIARFRSRRNIAGNPKPIDSTKPQGISKRQRSNTTPGKSRKDGT